MKKEKNKKEEYCCDCREVGKFFKGVGQKIKNRASEAEKYAKENPKEAKAIAAGVGAFLLAILAFIVGKKTKNKKDE